MHGVFLSYALLDICVNLSCHCGTPMLVYRHNDLDYANDKLKIAIIPQHFMHFEEMAHMFSHRTRFV
jgi:hypothetical protein